MPCCQEEHLSNLRLVNRVVTLISCRFFCLFVFQKKKKEIQFIKKFEISPAGSCVFAVACLLTRSLNDVLISDKIMYDMLCQPKFSKTKMKMVQINGEKKQTNKNKKQKTKHITKC